VNEDKSARYHRLGRRTGLLATICMAALLCGFMFSGASVALRQELVEHGTENAFLLVAGYVLLLSTICELATLPFSFYRGFLLERRYGLATETLMHWLKDHVKAVLVGLLFAELAATFIYFTLRTSPEQWWLLSGVGYSLVIIVLVNLAPVVLLPLFYTFKPLERAELRDRLTALATKTGARIIGVYEWTLSDRTTKANAALTGIGNTRRILLSDTLLAEYSDDEIEVILAHELAHHVHKDIWTSVMYDMGLMLTGLFIGHLVLRWAVPFFGLADAADPAGIPALLLTAGTVRLAAKPVMNAISRAHERRADSYALCMTNNPPAFISAMRRLGHQNLAEENPSRLVQALFYTHPPIRERLKVAQDWAVYVR
jgi:Zn-dependent protease with chaperone function